MLPSKHVSEMDSKISESVPSSINSFASKTAIEIGRPNKHVNHVLEKTNGRTVLNTRLGDWQQKHWKQRVMFLCTLTRPSIFATSGTKTPQKQEHVYHVF